MKFGEMHTRHSMLAVWCVGTVLVCIVLAGVGSMQGCIQVLHGVLWGSGVET